MYKDLTVGKPSQVLWQFCLPMFGSIIFQQLYNIADSLVAGKFIGENALAAVGNIILRGCGMMVRFMIATFSDLILRVGIAIVLSSTALGSTGIWMAWPVGWCIGTGLSLVFYLTAIRKVFAESPAKAEAEGKAAELRAEAEFAADAEMEVL